MIGNSSVTAASTELVQHCFAQGLQRAPGCSKAGPSYLVESSVNVLSDSRLVITTCCFDYITFTLVTLTQHRFGYSQLVILHVIELSVVVAHSHLYHWLPSCCCLVLLGYSGLFACREQPGYLDAASFATFAKVITFVNIGFACY